MTAPGRVAQHAAHLEVGLGGIRGWMSVDEAQDQGELERHQQQ